MSDKDILSGTDEHDAQRRASTLRTTINGQPAEWTPEIWQKWHTVADEADPKYTGAPVTSANYFTPNWCADDDIYDRGREEGFTYRIGRRLHTAIVAWSATIERPSRGRP